MQQVRIMPVIQKSNTEFSVFFSSKSSKNIGYRPGRKA
jgi:hypothetical protein